MIGVTADFSNQKPDPLEYAIVQITWGTDHGLPKTCNLISDDDLSPYKVLEKGFIELAKLLVLLGYSEKAKAIIKIVIEDEQKRTGEQP